MIAITGAAGFIGANLARRLADDGRRDLLIVDHPLDARRATNFVGLPEYRFVEHTAFLEGLADGAFEDVEVIFHLGACSDTTEADWGYLLRNNVEYAQSLWRWCASRGRPLIYASSAATYGNGSLGFDDRTSAQALRPLNLYGRSKNDFDIWAYSQAEMGHPTPRGWAGLKFFNVFGPREAHKGRMASMVWHSYNQIRERGEVCLFRSTDLNSPDGGQRRDFVFVEDCIDHLLWLWRHPEACGVFNSGTGRARTFIDLVDATFAAMGRPPTIRFIDMPDDLRGRYQNFTEARMDKLRKAGFPGTPTPLEEGVRRTVAWLDSR